MDNKNYRDILLEQFKEYVKVQTEKKYPNIMLIGITGAGKSSLINHLFKIKLSETSDSKSTTEGYTNIFYGRDYDRKVNFIDTEGYTLKKSDTYLQNVRNALKKEYDGLPVSYVWYCIESKRARINKDIEMLRSLYEDEQYGKRVCVIFTRTDDDTANRRRVNKQVLYNKGLGQIPIFEISLKNDEPKEELIKWSVSQFQEDDFKSAFVASQMGSLAVKKDRAEEIIKQKCGELFASKGADEITKTNRHELVRPAAIEMSYDIIRAYGVDCLEGLNKHAEQGAGLVTLFDTLDHSLDTILDNVKALKVAFHVGFTPSIMMAFGRIISNLCYYYVEKVLKDEPVKYEDFFTNPSVIALVSNQVSEKLSSLKGNNKDKKDKRTDPEREANQAEKDSEKQEQNPSSKEDRSGQINQAKQKKPITKKR